MYNETTLDHFLNPRNTGRVEGGPEGSAINPDCDDTVVISLRVEDAVVTDARFRSKGCAGAIACSSATTEMLLGQPVAEVANLRARQIVDHLGGLPDEKFGCAEMAASAAREALAAAKG